MPDLFDYQKSGVDWFQNLYNQGNGGILADEMGLGKTIQGLTFLQQTEDVRIALVVAPLSVVAVWANEAKTWAPRFKLVIFRKKFSKARFDRFLAEDFKVQNGENSSIAPKKKNALLYVTNIELITNQLELVRKVVIRDNLTDKELKRLYKKKFQKRMKNALDDENGEVIIDSDDEEDDNNEDSSDSESDSEDEVIEIKDEESDDDVPLNIKDEEDSLSGTLKFESSPEKSPEKKNPSKNPQSGDEVVELIELESSNSKESNSSKESKMVSAVDTSFITGEDESRTNSKNTKSADNSNSKNSTKKSSTNKNRSFKCSDFVPGASMFWDLLIVDEAHRLKDPSSTSFRNLRLLKTRGPDEEKLPFAVFPADYDETDPEAIGNNLSNLNGSNSNGTAGASSSSSSTGIFGSFSGLLNKLPMKKRAPGKKELERLEKEKEKLKNKVSGARRFLLTGTPVQNEVKDLWALMDICKPGLLGNLATFTKNFINPINKGSLLDANFLEVELKHALSQTLKDLTKTFILRRTKKGLKLPMFKDITKSDVVLWLKPSELQKNLYESVLDRADFIKKARDSGKMSTDVFKAINYLKKICNSPLICDPQLLNNWVTFMRELQGIKTEKKEPKKPAVGPAGGSADDTAILKASSPQKEDNKTNATGEKRRRSLSESARKLDMNGNATAANSSATSSGNFLSSAMSFLGGAADNSKRRRSSLEELKDALDDELDPGLTTDGEGAGGPNRFANRKKNSKESGSKNSKESVKSISKNSEKKNVTMDSANEFFDFSKILEPLRELDESAGPEDPMRKDVLKNLREQSSKLAFLADFLPTLIEKGHKILLFSASTKMLDVVMTLVLKPLKIKCLRIDGNVDAEERANKVAKFQSAKFQSRFDVFLASTQVGGVGLTLTAATRVVLIDPAWNPAIDHQAIDRCFRVGQLKDVVAYRLIVSGCIEEKMFRYQVFKTGLAKSCLEDSVGADGNENQGSSSSSSSLNNNAEGRDPRYFSERDIRDLFEKLPAEKLDTCKRLVEQHGEPDSARESYKNDTEDDDKNLGKYGKCEMPHFLELSDYSFLFGKKKLEEAAYAENDEEDEYEMMQNPNILKTERKKKVNFTSSPSGTEVLESSSDGGLNGNETENEFLTDNENGDLNFKQRQRKNLVRGSPAGSLNSVGGSKYPKTDGKTTGKKTLRRRSSLLQEAKKAQEELVQKSLDRQNREKRLRDEFEKSLENSEAALRDAGDTKKQRMNDKKEQKLEFNELKQAEKNAEKNKLAEEKKVAACERSLKSKEKEFDALTEKLNAAQSKENIAKAASEAATNEFEEIQESVKATMNPELEEALSSADDAIIALETEDEVSDENEIKSLWETFESETKEVKEKCKLLKQRELGKAFNEAASKSAIYCKERFKKLDLEKKTELFKLNNLTPVENELKGARLALSAAELQFSKKKSDCEHSAKMLTDLDNDILECEKEEEGRKKELKDKKELLRKEKEEIAKIKQEEKTLAKKNDGAQNEFGKMDRQYQLFQEKREAALKNLREDTYIENQHEEMHNKMLSKSGPNNLYHGPDLFGGLLHAAKRRKMAEKKEKKEDVK